MNIIRRFCGVFASLAPLYKTLRLLTYLLTSLLVYQSTAIRRTLHAGAEKRTPGAVSVKGAIKILIVLLVPFPNADRFETQQYGRTDKQDGRFFQ